MSIYPVRIKTWFPPVLKSEHKEENEQNKMHRQSIRILLQFTECETCGKKVKMRNGWVYHAMPYRYGDEAWCSIHCLKGDKK